MEALKRKLNSRRGASILLALLFLLVCMMAGASVVMAAASNAGKIRSNKDEQQKYLILTSALTLLCDELQSVEYEGHYKIIKTTEERKETNAVTGSEVTYTDTIYTYEQKPGQLNKRDDSGKLESNDWTNDNGSDTGKLQGILPLLDNWNYVFAGKFVRGDEEPGNLNANRKIKKYTPSPDSVAPAPAAYSYTLTFTDSKSKETVNITVTVNERSDDETIIIDDTIILYATLEGYPMEVRATFEPTGKGPGGLELLDPNDSKITEYEIEDSENSDTVTTYKTDPVTWELKEIVKMSKTEEVPDEDNP